MALSKSILDTLIQNQRDAVNRHSLYSLSVILMGVLILVSSNLLIANNITDTVKVILNVGGAFVSTVSAYPINQVILRKEKLSIFQTFKANFNNMSPEEVKKVEELIWNSIKAI